MPAADHGNSLRYTDPVSQPKQSPKDVLASSLSRYVPECCLLYDTDLPSANTRSPPTTGTPPIRRSSIDSITAFLDLFSLSPDQAEILLDALLTSWSYTATISRTIAHILPNGMRGLETIYLQNGECSTTINVAPADDPPHAEHQDQVTLVDYAPGMPNVALIVEKDMVFEMEV